MLGWHPLTNHTNNLYSQKKCCQEATHSDILRGLTPSFFMARMRDPLVHGFWCVGYVLNGEDKVATFFQMESAQEALVRMMKMGVECNGMWEWKPENK